MANNRCYDIAVAFLNSFRRYNEGTALCMIPFDSDCSKVRDLSGVYGFEIFSNAKTLDFCDTVAMKMHGRVLGQYRKLASWSGEFDEFICIDCDTVVLKSLSPAFTYLNGFGVVTGHSHIEGSRKFVWKDSVLGTSLDPARIEYSANTGFFVSRKHEVNSVAILDALDEAITVREHLELSCAEQPFLNVLFTRLARPYSSLYKIGLDTKDANILTECWAGDPRWDLSVEGPCYYNRERKNVLFVHWAGEWAPLSDSEILGDFVVRRTLKQRATWEYFRRLSTL